MILTSQSNEDNIKLRSHSRFLPRMASLFISYHFLLQILLEPVCYLAKQMVAGIAT